MADINVLKIGNNNYEIVPETARSMMDASKPRRVKPLPYYSWPQVDPTHNTPVYFENLLKQLVIDNRTDLSDCMLIGAVNPNETGRCLLYIYSVTDYNNTGLPQYASGTYWAVNGIRCNFGTIGGVWYFRECSDDNTTYPNLAAASGGADVSLVTTGEKYTWNNKVSTSDLDKLYIHLIELKMLGWSVPEEMTISNTIENGVFHQKIGRVDLGSLSWTKYSTYWACDTYIPKAKTVASTEVPNIYSKVLTPHSSDTIASVGFGSNYVAIYHTNANLIATSTESPTGYFYYELANEILIPIDGNEKDVQLEEELDLNGYGEDAGGRNLLKADDLVQGMVYFEIGYEYIISQEANPSPNFVSTKLIPIKEGQKFVISILNGGTKIGKNNLAFYGVDKKIISLQGYNFNTPITIPSNAKYLVVRFYNANATITPQDVIIKQVQIEYGEKASPYHPYIKSNKMLGDEISILSDVITDVKFLGWSVPEEMELHNYVDKDGKFHQRVQRVDMSTYTWLYGSYTTPILRVAESGVTPTGTPALFSNKFQYGGLLDFQQETNRANAKTNTFYMWGTNLWLKAGSYTTVESFKNDNKGVYLYYELATEIVIPEGKEIDCVPPSELGSASDMETTIDANTIIDPYVPGTKFNLVKLGRITNGPDTTFYGLLITISPGYYGNYVQQLAIDGNKMAVYYRSKFTSWTTWKHFVDDLELNRVLATAFQDNLFDIYNHVGDMAFLGWSIPEMAKSVEPDVHNGYIVDGKFAQKYDRVSLDSLVWAYSSTSNAFYATVPGMRYINGSYTIKGYIHGYTRQEVNWGNLNNLSFCLGQPIRETNKAAIGIKNTSYTDVNSFVNYLTSNNLYLYFELETGKGFKVGEEVNSYSIEQLTVSASTNFTPGSPNNVYVKRSGSVVNLTLNMVGSISAVNTAIPLCTLPVQYRPKTNIVLHNFVTQRGVIMLLYVDLTGVVYLYAISSVINSDWICRQSITWII